MQCKEHFCLNVFRLIGSEVLSTMVMENSVFWEITPCIPLTLNGLHRGVSQKTELLIFLFGEYLAKVKENNF
jgi:hypothetical protein